MMTMARGGKRSCCKAAAYEGGQTRTPAYMKATARLFAREAINTIRANGLLVSQGGEKTLDEVAEKLNALSTKQILAGSLADMNLVAKELVA